MKTEDLLANLEEARGKLEAVGVALAACRAKGTLGAESYAFFDSFPGLQVQWKQGAREWKQGARQSVRHFWVAKSVCERLEEAAGQWRLEAV